MKGYLGEQRIPVEETPFKDFKKEDWAMYFIEKYGQIDGDNHKAWLLDEIAKILHGTSVVVRLASWDNGTQEYRVETGVPSKKYRDWVKSMGGESRYERGIDP